MHLKIKVYLIHNLFLLENNNRLSCYPYYFKLNEILRKKQKIFLK
jgi:hypothetical protein